MPELTPINYYVCKSALNDAWTTDSRDYIIRYDDINHRNQLVKYDYSCTCPSYKYAKGLDNRGYCKHIRIVINNGWHCNWNQFLDAGEPIDDGCPKCGRNIDILRMGV